MRGLAELPIADRVLRRARVQFRLAAAGRLTGRLADELRRQDEADEVEMNALYHRAMRARGLTIYGKPLRRLKMRTAVEQ